MTIIDALEQGRLAFARRSWSEAYAGLSEAAVNGPLDVDDLEHLAIAAELIGRHEESSDVMARAHQESVRTGDLARAAYEAFWLGFGLMGRGEFARGGGWMARAAGMVEEHDLDSVTRGYLELPGAIRSTDEGDAATALAGFERASEVAARFGDRDLATLARMGRGNSLIALGEKDRGVALLDEAMVAVTAGEVGPIVAGIVYCTTIECCQQMFDLGRAQEWTAALTRWCDSQPDMVPFRGRCMLYRAELLAFHGEWGDAVEETERAYIRLSEPPPEPAVGAALYQQAELHRLRGEFEQADARYRQAAEWGRPPEPGLAQLRLAQGDREGALGIIRRALDERRDPSSRTRLLEPAIEISLANGDVRAARTAADELAATAEASRAPLVRAMAARALGAVSLAEGDGRAALASLRQAWTGWQELEAPFEVAQARVLIGRACRALGDEATAQIEFDAARRAFEALGAGPDVARVDAELKGTAAVPTGPTSGDVAGLTAREIEVLRLVAAGKSNRAIAEALVISEKTVARHVSNIFLKLDVSSRSAATAYAYEHGLQASPT
jgi:DNA-binding CsgD family transcriptional regulator/tetratricopeptide (TPR) repeat protein